MERGVSWGRQSTVSFQANIGQNLGRLLTPYSRHRRWGELISNFSTQTTYVHSSLRNQKTCRTLNHSASSITCYSPYLLLCLHIFTLRFFPFFLMNLFSTINNDILFVICFIFFLLVVFFVIGSWRETYMGLSLSVKAGQTLSKC